MKGRKPIPNALKLLRGNPGRRKINPDEPIPSEGTPLCPEHLMDGAKTEWYRMVPLLKEMGLLSKVDMAALAGYCQTFGRWRAAEDEIKRLEEKHPGSGMLIKTKSGNIIQNPLLGIANRSMAMMLKFLSEFGLTPSSRSRIHVENPKKKSETEDYLFQVKPCKKQAQ